MDEKTTYKLNEDKQQKRLAQFSADTITADLSDSIALTKTLIESAANAGQSVLVKDLLNVLANLTKAHRLEQVRAGELLNKNACRRLGRDLAEIVADELQDIPGFEDIVDRVLARVGTAIAAAHNDQASEAAA
jgi:hypothetical protein